MLEPQIAAPFPVFCIQKFLVPVLLAPLPATFHQPCTGHLSPHLIKNKFSAFSLHRPKLSLSGVLLQLQGVFCSWRTEDSGLVFCNPTVVKKFCHHVCLSKQREPRKIFSVKMVIFQSSASKQCLTAFELREWDLLFSYCGLGTTRSSKKLRPPKFCCRLLLLMGKFSFFQFLSS